MKFTSNLTTIPLTSVSSFSLQSFSISDADSFVSSSSASKRNTHFVVMFAFFFMDLFDTLGTLIGVSIKAGFLDRDGRLPRITGALCADAVATSVGAALGTSTTTTYMESAAGVAAGGMDRARLIDAVAKMRG